MLPPVEMPATSTGPSPSERIASACSAASSAIDIPRGSPFLRLTNTTRRCFANGSSNDPVIHSVPVASTPVSSERPPTNSSGGAASRFKAGKEADHAALHLHRAE